MRSRLVWATVHTPAFGPQMTRCMERILAAPTNGEWLWSVRGMPMMRSISALQGLWGKSRAPARKF
jgi:hypothetical protein